MTPLPLPVVRALSKLGHDLSRARRLRQITQASLAERIEASLATVRRMERGDPRIPVHFLARALMVFGELPRLHELLDGGQDPIGRALADERLPQRVRPRKSPQSSTPGAL
jgi:transcriptional regulator with XRE-family HTH domain